MKCLFKPGEMRITDEPELSLKLDEHDSELESENKG